MSDFLDRVRRRRCSISITLTKLDFNVHAVSACICKQYHGRRKKLDNLPRISRFQQISLRGSYAASAILFSVERIVARNNKLSQRDRKLKADNPLGQSTLR